MTVLAVISIPITIPAVSFPDKISGSPIANELLTQVTNSERVTEIPIPKDSFLRHIRLYVGAINGDCAEETTIICSYRYFLAISSGDMEPDQAIYDLGEFGELSIAWEGEDLSDPRNPKANLVLRTLNFPEHAFIKNPELERKSRIFKLTVGFTSIKSNE